MKALKLMKIILESVNERGVSRSFTDSGYSFASSAPFALNIPGFHSSRFLTFNLAPFLSRSRGTRKRGKTINSRKAGFHHFGQSSGDFR